MRKLAPVIFLIILALLVFHSWFSPGLLSTFDFPYYSPLMMQNAHMSLYAWDWHVSLDGFARFFSPYSFVFPFIFIPQVILGKYLGMDWGMIERVVYLYPLLFLLIFSPLYLFKTIFPHNKFYFFSVLIFSFNTYSLLLAGGEVYLALAYALIPLIFALYIKIINRRSLKLSLFTGCIIAVQIMMDPRITYVTMFAVTLYVLYIYQDMRNYVSFLTQFVYLYIIPFAVIGLLQAYWVLPSLLYGSNPVTALGAAYSSSTAVTFFSFAKFENTIALLHPNWPDNIFGKVYFMRWEFLLQPVLAFSSLLFMSSQALKNSAQKVQVKHMLFFAFLGLIGAFLSKGAEDPFGSLYLWMFSHIPGFIMFRDPSKWYPLIALSYSILIPFTVWKICDWLKDQKKLDNEVNVKVKLFSTQNIFLLVITCVLLYLIRPALSGQLNGMFQITQVPNDYANLEKFISIQPDYFRTLWYPSKQRFGFYSQNHPEMSAQVLLNNYDDNKLIAVFSDNQTERLLQESSIGYVIIPNDSEKEIFVTNRLYDEKKYKNTVIKLDSVKWLKKQTVFGKSIVYKVPAPKDHFWSPAKSVKISYQYVNPTKYYVVIKNAIKGEHLVFSEQFDKNWKMEVMGSTIQSPSSIYDALFNSFILPRNGDYTLEVYFATQKWVDIGVVVSAVSLMLVICSLIILQFTERKRNL